MAAFYTEQQKQGQQKRDSLAADLRRVQQKIRLTDMRLNDEIDADSFTRKQVELREREGELQLQMEAAGREQSEIAELAVNAFELSQGPPARWVIADIAVKRQILEIVCLNWTLDGASLVSPIRKPFNVLAEGLVSADDRSYWIRTICPRVRMGMPDTATARRSVSHVPSGPYGTIRFPLRRWDGHLSPKGKAENQY